ncbi:MAG: hypothetical protein ACE5HG_03250 [Candidatus Bathyarchaeia archaeon]
MSRRRILLERFSRNMRAAAIFVAFFLLFTCASIAVPVPLFPGNMVPMWFGIPLSEYTPYIEAVANGLLYGFITWTVFFLINRKMDKTLSADSKGFRKKKEEF